MILLEKNSQTGVLSVRLNRPQLRNAFAPEMIERLTQAFLQAAKDDSLRLIVLSGEGASFCAGADLNWMRSMVNFSKEENEKDADKLFLMFQAIAQCPHPVLGLVQGAAFGGGLGLVACCDYVLAEEKTQFCFSEVKLGLVPSVISQFVLRKSFQGAVSPWMLSGQVFGAVEAHRLGLVFEVVESESLQERALELQRSLLRAAPEAVRATKKLLEDLRQATPEQSRQITVSVIAERRVSAEGQLGLKAFLDKQDPPWIQEASS